MTETGMLTLAGFLLARIAHDEAVAREVVAILRPGSTGLYDPARVLAECEAKRLIMELHPRVRYGEVGGECECCGADVWRDVADQYPCGTLRALALPYTDHPDCRDEWRA